MTGVGLRADFGPAAAGATTMREMGAGEAETSGHAEARAPASDRELVARLMAGDPEALSEVYRHYAGVVFGVSRRVMHDDTLAEDVTQEVFLSLWQHPERFDGSRGSLRTWLGLLAHHRSVDRVRAESRRARVEAPGERPATGDEIDEHLTALWLSDRVRLALAKLPAEQREVVVAAYGGERSYRQVAVDLALPEGTVKSRVRLALVKLDKLLRTEFGDQDTPAWT